MAGKGQPRNWHGTPHERFERFVEPEPNTGCWLWTGPLTGEKRLPYGHFQIVTYKSLRAHRASWILFNGPIPDDKIVCHKCDVSLCVNASHLYLGTHKENMADCLKRGRYKTIFVSGNKFGFTKGNKWRFTKRESK